MVEASFEPDYIPMVFLVKHYLRKVLTCGHNLSYIYVCGCHHPNRGLPVPAYSVRAYLDSAVLDAGGSHASAMLREV